MGTTEWGPAAWKFLHTATFAYGNADGIVTENDRYAARALFESLRFMLPCKNCCSHYCEALEKRPLTDEVLRDKESLSRWFVEIHNDVNLRLKKPIFKYDDAKTLYESFVGCSVEGADTSSEGSCGLPQPVQAHTRKNDSQLLIVGVGVLGLLVGLLVGLVLRRRGLK
jgi:hypothetical protein